MIVSSDGGKIAFPSNASESATETSIYIVPKDGGEPERVDSSIQFTSDRSNYSIGEVHGPTVLIGR